uniref:Capsid protein n=1 Tax=Atrato Sobemo-like virus 3 TaxID=2689349 RepID=A0A6B9KGM2_9VIRU|nr:putative coat protein [Atrato Sobemo-like virus 3]
MTQHKNASHQQARPATRPAPNPRRRQPARIAPQGAREGELVLARSELLCTITLEKMKTEAMAAIKLLPTAEALSWLNALSGHFDQIEWLAVKLLWKPCVGTTFNGSVLFGVDWNAGAVSAVRNKVQACVPHMDTPLWQQGSMLLPAARLQSRRFYVPAATEAVDQAPCVILYNVRATAQTADTVVGDVWIEYRVRLMGPTA